MSEEVLGELSDTTKLNYIGKRNKQITDKEKMHLNIGAKVDKDKNLAKMRKGVAMAKGKLGEKMMTLKDIDDGKPASKKNTITIKKDQYAVKPIPGNPNYKGKQNPKFEKEENVQEISNELVKKVADKRNVNVSMAGSKADYDRRDPDYQKAANKQHKNQMLRFGRGASKIRKAGSKPFGEGYTDKEVRMAKGIAFDKRHVGGDYTGAAKKMEKIKKGLSDHPKAKDALRRANEQKDFAKGLFQQEAIERRADRKTIIATDPATGRKVVKMAPKKEIDVGKGKMA